MRRPTLRRRLTALTAAAVATAVIGLSVLAWSLLRLQLHNQTEQNLRVEASHIALRRSPMHLPPVPPFAQPADATLFGEVLPDGSRTKPPHQSSYLPVNPTDVNVARDAASSTLRAVTIGGSRYLLLTVHGRGHSAVQVASDLSENRATLKDFALVLLVADALVVLATAVLGYVLTRAGLRPVERVRMAAQGVALTQNLHAAVPIADSDPQETASVAGSLNAMLAALSTSRDAQRQLVEDAGHELATPLTSLRTNIELLLRAEQQPDRMLAPEDRRRLLTDIQAQTGELSSLMAEVVDLAMDPATLEAPTELDLADVAAAALARARSRTPDYTFRLSAAPSPVHGRGSILERAVLNLLDNAAKFSDPSEVIDVDVAAQDAVVRLSVTDHGRGIAEADLERVFQRFHRSTEARSLVGSGLGLSIVRQVIAAHGGQVWLERGATGGTIARVALPRSVSPHRTNE
ncbi:MAG: sensor histidine kinase [Sciscionella sp.]